MDRSEQFQALYVRVLEIHTRLSTVGLSAGLERSLQPGSVGIAPCRCLTYPVRGTLVQ